MCNPNCCKFVALTEDTFRNYCGYHTKHSPQGFPDVRSGFATTKKTSETFAAHAQNFESHPSVGCHPLLKY